MASGVKSTSVNGIEMTDLTCIEEIRCNDCVDYSSCKYVYAACAFHSMCSKCCMQNDKPFGVARCRGKNAMRLKMLYAGELVLECFGISRAEE